MSSRSTRVEPNAGRLPVSGFHVSPKSSVTNTYGLSSSDRWASKHDVAPAPWRTATRSMRRHPPRPGQPRGLELLGHVRPRSCRRPCVTHRQPSSVPAQSTSGFRGDSASAVPLPCLVRVISGEIGLQVVALLDRPEHVLAGRVEDARVVVDRMNGVFQLNRNGSPGLRRGPRRTIRAARRSAGSAGPCRRPGSRRRRCPGRSGRPGRRTRRRR